MGYCCFCIPLRVYALLLGCLQFTAAVFQFLQFSTISLNLYEYIRLVYGTLAVFSGTLALAAGFLITGILMRRDDYIAKYLILIVLSIAFLLIGACVSAFVNTIWVLILLMQLIVTCLLSFPIYFLFIENDDGNKTGLTV